MLDRYNESGRYLTSKGNSYPLLVRNKVFCESCTMFKVFGRGVFCKSGG